MAIHCPVCGWSFRDEEAMRKHMALHSDDELSPGSEVRTQVASNQAAAAGWYPDPNGGGERDWDGADWTWRRSRRPKPNFGDVRLLLSYVAAILLPVVGLIAGIFILRRSPLHGVAILLISITVATVGLLLVSGHDSSHGGFEGVVSSCTKHFDWPVHRMKACINRATRP